MAGKRQRPRNSQTVTPVDLGECVTSLVKSVTKGMADRVAPYGLVPLEFSILRVFLDRRECTASQLAEVLPIDSSRVSRMVNKMVEMGLLRRRRLRNDRRVVRLTLTEEGMALTSKIHQRVQAYNAELTEGVSNEEMTVFAAITSRIAANSAALKEEPPP